MWTLSPSVFQTRTMSILYVKLNKSHIAVQTILVKINATILKNININKGILENINIDKDINKEILENIDIDKEISENIDIDKISNR